MSEKIYFVVHSFSHKVRGGVNRVVAETANELSIKENIDVNILSLGGDIEKTSYPVLNGVKVHTLNMKKYSTNQYKGIFKILWLIYAYLEVVRFYKKQNKNAVWNITSPALIILFSLIPKNNNKFIGCEHISPQRTNGNYITNSLRKYFLNKNDLNISLNKSDDLYYKSNGIKSELVYNGVKFPENIDVIREKIIIFVGRFDDQKNPLEALEIFYKSKVWEQGYVLKFFGRGKYHENILNKIKEYNINNFVEIISNENDPDIIYKKASLLILTSRYEGFGMVLVEAMSRGIPCVSYDCPHGPSDILINGVNGYLVNNGDRDDFINKVDEVLLNNYPLIQVVESVRKFEIENISKKWQKILKIT